MAYTNMKYRQQHSCPMLPRHPERGFTLLELMIVVVVISLLSAIALPAYNRYVERAHRADARAGLLQTQLWLERAATATGQYPTTLPTAMTWGSDTSKRYAISFSSGNTASAYTLIAEPKSGSTQSNDACGTFTLSNAGVRGAAGKTAGANGYNVDCWGK